MAVGRDLLEQRRKAPQSAQHQPRRRQHRSDRMVKRGLGMKILLILPRAPRVGARETFCDLRELVGTCFLVVGARQT